jgi:hypothetical protein
MAISGLHAPPQHGAILCVPPLAEADRLLAENLRLFQAAYCRIFDRPLSAFRQETQSEALAIAREFSRSHGFSVPPMRAGPVVMTGHQPELFHPGVWLKNFAVSRLAGRRGGVGCNLIVDNDVVTAPGFKVPLCQSGRPVAFPVPLDRPRPAVPWEEWHVEDEPRFAQVPQVVAELTGDWPFVPLLPGFWPLLGTGPRLGGRLAVGRHRVEEQWGCRNLELPLGRLCDTLGFQRFFLHIVLDLTRFRDAYNDALADYRRRRRLKSARHPIPDLERQGDWLEAPFWIWSVHQPQRQRLYVRRQGETLQLGTGTQTCATLPLAKTSSAQDDMLGRALETEGWKIRSRALTTTLFVRLCLADLFVHGIGGAIYDEITDGIIRRFFSIEPPAFLTITGTLRLPFAPCHNGELSSESAHRLRRELRDLRYKPERWLGDDPRPEVRQLLETKRRWIAEQPADAEAKRLRWRRLQEVTEALSGYVADRRRVAEHQLAKFLEAEEMFAVLCNREYAFCLHPEAALREWLDSLSES